VRPAEFPTPIAELWQDSHIVEESRMPYNDRLMKARFWIYGAGALVVGCVALWKIIFD